jgi:hypothetical protein
VLGISGVVFDAATAEDQFKTDPVLKGITPTDDHNGKFAILIEPLPANAIGRAVLSGVWCVEINVTDEDHEYADVSDGSHYLMSGVAGSAQILDKASGTGLQWAHIRLGCKRHQARWIEFVVNAAGGFSTTDASVAVDGITYHDGREPQTPVTTVYNTRASSDYKFEGDDDDRGEALYAPEEDKYYIIQMECP